VTGVMLSHSLFWPLAIGPSQNGNGRYWRAGRGCRPGGPIRFAQGKLPFRPPDPPHSVLALLTECRGECVGRWVAAGTFVPAGSRQGGYGPPMTPRNGNRWGVLPRGGGTGMEAEAVGSRPFGSGVHSLMRLGRGDSGWTRDQL